jgi:hypothetical protein
MWQFTYSYTPVEHEIIQRADRAVTTWRLPLDRGNGMQSPAPIYLGTSPAYIVTAQIPRGPRPNGSTGKGLGRTQRHDEPPPQHKSISIHEYDMNMEA